MGKPAASSLLFPVAGTAAWVVSHNGDAAAISHWWLRNEPPNAAWKKWSAMT